MSRLVPLKDLALSSVLFIDRRSCSVLRLEWLGETIVVSYVDSGGKQGIISNFPQFRVTVLE